MITVLTTKYVKWLVMNHRVFAEQVLGYEVREQRCEYDMTFKDLPHAARIKLIDLLLIYEGRKK